MATDLSLMVEEVQDPQNQLLDILHVPGSSQTALPIHKAILQPAQSVWHTPASCAPTPKCTESRYIVPSKGTVFLFTHPPSNLLVIHLVTKHSRQHHLKSILSDRAAKIVGPFGQKTLLFCGNPVLYCQLPGSVGKIRLSHLL